MANHHQFGVIALSATRATLAALVIGTALVVGRGVMLSEVSLAGEAAIASEPARPAPTLLLVAPPALEDAAALWTEYRTTQGWQVVRIGEPHLSDAATLRAEVRRRAHAALDGGMSQLAVLLLGDVSDSPQAPKAGDPAPAQPFVGIPTFRFAQPDPRLIDRSDPQFASDHPYQLLDDEDERPDLALGRIPVRSNAEAMSVFHKIRRYEAEAPTGAWRHRINYLAGEGRFGAGDAVMESLFRSMVDSMVPPAFEISMTYAHPSSPYCPPPSQLEATFTRRFTEGSLLVNYLGHGFPFGLDRMRWGAKRVPMLTMKSIAGMNEESAQLPIAYLGCCSVGWYDRPDGAPSLAEAMLTAPGGPIAVIAGSRPTHPYGTAILQKDLTRGLLEGRIETIGELDRLATRGMLETDSDDVMLDAIVRPVAALGRWPCTLPQLRVMHARLYNLLGDPTTRIAHPPPPPASLELVEGTLRGAVGTPCTGRVTVEIETTRESIASGPLPGPATRDDPALEERAAELYPRVNSRVLWRGTTTIEEGRFALALPIGDSELWPRAAMIRVAIDAIDADGQSFLRLGGLRIDAPVQSAPNPSPGNPSGGNHSGGNHSGGNHSGGNQSPAHPDR